MPPSCGEHFQERSKSQDLKAPAKSGVSMEPQRAVVWHGRQQDQSQDDTSPETKASTGGTGEMTVVGMIAGAKSLQKIWVQRTDWQPCWVSMAGGLGKPRHRPQGRAPTTKGQSHPQLTPPVYEPVWLISACPVCPALGWPWLAFLCP